MVTAMATSSTDIAGDLIKNFEGLSLSPYYCLGGRKTIGYGHVLRKGEEQYPLNLQITQKQAEELLKQDIEGARAALRKHCRVPLSARQEAALISFIFNCGSGAFQASAMRQKLERGEYLLAAEEFPRWVYAGGVKLAGLIKRREVERKIFLAGTH
jgi:lysozyme